MSMDDVTNSIAGVIPLVVVSGVAMKMTDSMFGNNKQENPCVECESKKKKKLNKSAEEFKGGNGFNSPF